jgi:hypothetical protein
MRVGNRASVAYAAASCRPRLRGKNVDAAGLRIARLAYVMHYFLGTRAHVMRTTRDAHNATACTLMRTLGKSLRRALTSSDNHIQRDSFSAIRRTSMLKASVLAERQLALQSRWHDTLRPVLRINGSKKRARLWLDTPVNAQ